MSKDFEDGKVTRVLPYNEKKREIQNAIDKARFDDLKGREYLDRDFFILKLIEEEKCSASFRKRHEQLLSINEGLEAIVKAERAGGKEDG